MDKNFISLAKRCAMGDIEAMAEFADWFRSGFSEELRGLTDAYENTADSADLEALKGYMSGKPDDIKLSLGAYMMWMVRAALYGHEKAGRIVERCSYYKEKAYLPLKMFLPGNNEHVSVWSSRTLYKLGLLDFNLDLKDCRLLSIRPGGYYVFFYVSYYDPADADGFGMETEYEEIYFDEFFNRLPIEKESDIPSALAALRQARTEYQRNNTSL